jgi:hypothetical protein
MYFAKNRPTYCREVQTRGQIDRLVSDKTFGNATSLPVKRKNFENFFHFVKAVPCELFEDCSHKALKPGCFAGRQVPLPIPDYLALTFAGIFFARWMRVEPKGEKKFYAKTLA